MVFILGLKSEKSTTTSKIPLPSINKNKVWLDPNETNEIANANSSKLKVSLMIEILTSPY
jgi:phosphopantothenate synthetase